LVVQDTASYQKLMERAERAERSEQREALRVSVDEMRSGQGIPAEEVLTEMRQILADAKKKKSP
jgi:hypothetical protein